MATLTRARIIIPALLCLLVACFAITSTTVEAIPAFARKYSMSCTTCHAPIPRLKAFGDEFAGNGFELENQESKRYTMKAGDDRLELLRNFPLAARLDGFIKYQSETDKDVDFTTPYNLKLLSGGRLGKHVAFYFYFFLSERGEVAGIEDAYIMFNNLLGQDLDIYLGQFQVSDPLFKRELRLTYEDYMIYKYHPERSGIDLAYDRGVMITWGIENGPDVIVEVLNGNGIGEADKNRVYDNDKYKTFCGRLSYDIGDYLRVGGFGYYGKEQAAWEDYMGDPYPAINEVYYFGPDITIGTEQIELNGQFMIRKDDNPNFDVTKPDDELTSQGGLAELIYWPSGDQSRWYLTGLYNYIETDPGGDADAVTQYHTITGHAGYLLQTNLRLIAEFTYDIEYEESRAMVGFVSGF